MGQLRNFVTPLHQATARDYLGRMLDEKVHCMKVAKQYDFDYWDGDRRYGYGGYRYIPGRWQPVAAALIETYDLGPGSKVLDVGCGKGFLLYELLKLQPQLQVCGFDSSEYALNHSKEEIRPYLFQHSVQATYPFKDQDFDLVISLGTLHNLEIFDLEIALEEINRVGKSGYIMVESYRSEEELFNLQCWALTAQAFFNVSEWIWLYHHFGYRGDYEFIFF